MKPISKIIPSSNEENQDQMHPGNDEGDRVGEIIERTQREIKQTRHEFEDHMEKCQAGFRNVRALWAIVVLLALGVGGISWYAYRSIDNHKTTLAQKPVLQNLTGSMDNRLKSVEGKMTDWNDDQTSLTERMARLEKQLSSTLKAAGNQAQSAASQMGQRIREEIHQNLERLEGRVGNVESAQRESRDQLAAARTEIGRLRQEIAGLQKQNEDRLAEFHQTQTNVNRLNSQMGAVNDQVMAHTASLNALNEEVERQPVNFELSANQTQQVAPGIYLTVSHTDLAHQRVDGWMQLADEGRIMWIHSLGAQQALTFVPRSEDRTCELVFTGVQQNGATGYLLLPRSAQSPLSSAN